MADNRSRLEKYLGMLGSDQMGERAAAALKIHELAKAENKTIVELCMGPQPQRQESRHQQQEPRRDSSYQPFRQRGSHFNDDFFEELERRAKAAREAKAAKREAESAKQRYSGAFDDAEMTDAQRQEARAHKAEQKRRQRPKNRSLLDELAEAYRTYDDGGLETWEEEFAAVVPHRLRADHEMSAKQERTARMIIAKIRRNQGESPI